MNPQQQRSIGHLLCVAALVCVLAVNLASAGQGCPFDDGSCQTYCNQQGCNLGYCGHFAWIQCICRKCGDEWNWYDKVHYNPDKQVNQTELDSLKLNGSAPIILTNNNEQRGQQQQQQQPGQQAQPLAEKVAPKVTEPAAGSAATKEKEATKSKGATLTTLLIPDLSDSSKLDLNDIPDENSEKFLDFLAKNHEKLAQATGAKQAEQAPPSEAEPENNEEETVEIQISSSNNQQAGPTATAAARADDIGSSAPVASTPTVAPGNEPGQDEEEEEQQEQTRHSAGRPAGGSVTRLLRMAAHERLADDLY